MWHKTCKGLISMAALKKSHSWRSGKSDTAVYRSAWCRTWENSTLTGERVNKHDCTEVFTELRVERNAGQLLAGKMQNTPNKMLTGKGLISMTAMKYSQSWGSREMRYSCLQVSVTWKRSSWERKVKTCSHSSSGRNSHLESCSFLGVWGTSLIHQRPGWMQTYSHATASRKGNTNHQSTDFNNL